MSLEEFWAQILGGDPIEVVQAWAPLNVEARQAVYEHLQRMVLEEGWAEIQREAAREAISIIDAMSVE